MAKILIVDDNAMNRKLLASVLHHQGHETIEAVDGKDALAALHAGRPQLVMSDILMPTMDGYEFVRQLRADAELGETPVIFHTAYYHEREAQRLAQICGVARVLGKPSEAAEILEAVGHALSGKPVQPSPELAEEFDRQHLQLITNKLSHSATELRAANTRFAALIELNVQLASEREPRVLLERVCHAARDLLGAKYAVLAVSTTANDGASLFATSGLDSNVAPDMRPEIAAGSLGQVLAQRQPLRVFNPEAGGTDIGLPACYPPARAFLAAPLSSLTRTYGWICLADKIGAEGFNAEDEKILATLGAQVGRIYENGSLYREVENHAAQLLVEMEKREGAAAQLRESETRFRQMAESIQDLFFLISADFTRTFYLSPAYERIWGRPRSAAYDNSFDWTHAIHPDDVERVRAETHWDRGGGAARNSTLECRIVRPDQSVRWILSRTFLIRDETNTPTRIAGVITDITERKEAEARIHYLAYHDVLTGLPNRTFFHERLSVHVNTAARGERQLALVIAQLERFDSISDSLGRHAADQLLRELAERFTQCVGDPAVVARIGPDQFAALILDIQRDSDVVRTLEEWWPQWLNAPFQVEGNELRLSANAGVALFPFDGTDTDVLLKHAEAALKKARTTGDRYQFYTRHLSERGTEKLALESKLRRALENDEFVLHYQPKVDLETRRIQGLEALIRWQDPDTGLVPPAQFIPLMEETGIISDVGAWVLQQACLDRSRWLDRGINTPRVAINVSTLQLRRNDFVRTVKNALRGAGSEAGIDIEVTESLIMQDVDENIAKLAAIRDLGVRIAIDDFGTGYSSLGYLAKLPAEMLKIDRSFIISMLDDPSAMTLVSTIISLAHALRLEVVAEGVESEEQAKILRLVRCDQMQGYLISKPLSFDDMTTYLGGPPVNRLADE